MRPVINKDSQQKQLNYHSLGNGGTLYVFKEYNDLEYRGLQP